MEDALVGFEVAKLAKEKGFNEKSVCGYTRLGRLMTIDRSEESFFAGASRSYKNSELESYNKSYLKYNDDEYICIYTAPTQSLLQRWLREEHGLIIAIVPTFTYALTTNVGYYAYVEKVNKEINTLEYLYMDIYFSATYEESLEGGLLEALKLI